MKHWWNVKAEKLQTAIAWTVPRWLAKWCFVRVVANATTGRYASEETPSLRCVDALERW